MQRPQPMQIDGAETPDGGLRQTTAMRRSTGPRRAAGAPGPASHARSGGQSRTATRRNRDGAATHARTEKGTRPAPPRPPTGRSSGASHGCSRARRHMIDYRLRGASFAAADAEWEAANKPGFRCVLGTWDARHSRDTSETLPRHFRDTSETLPRHLPDKTALCSLRRDISRAPCGTERLQQRLTPQSPIDSTARHRALRQLL